MGMLFHASTQCVSICRQAALFVVLITTQYSVLPAPTTPALAHPAAPGGTAGLGEQSNIRDVLEELMSKSRNGNCQRVLSLPKSKSKAVMEEREVRNPSVGYT